MLTLSIHLHQSRGPLCLLSLSIHTRVEARHACSFYPFILEQRPAILAFSTHPTLGQRPAILILTYNALQLGPSKIPAFTGMRLKLTYKGCLAVRPA